MRLLLLLFFSLCLLAQSNTNCNDADCNSCDDSGQTCYSCDSGYSLDESGFCIYSSTTGQTVGIIVGVVVGTFVLIILIIVIASCCDDDIP